MKKFIACIGLLTLLLVLSSSRAQELINPEKKDNFERRILLIAADEFKNHKSTFGACVKNAEALGECFANFKFLGINREYNNINSETMFKRAIVNAFIDADEEDINYVYISSHGIYDGKNLDSAAIVLSDGQQDININSRIIEEAFKGIKGTNFLIFDACNSGAIIGRGVSGGSATSRFYGKNFKILTSSGGSELSWHWSEQQGVVKLMGAGYFSSALSHALSKKEAYPADYNRDGSIRLYELYNYLYENQPSSVPQVYPFADDFEVFSYDMEDIGEYADMHSIEFYDTQISDKKPYVNFKFEVKNELVPVYQLVYYRDGGWDFENPIFYYDYACLREEENNVIALKPGVYKRKLSLPKENGKSGYALIYILAKKGDNISFVTGRLIRLMDNDGLKNIEIKCDKAFQPLYGQELPITIKHEIPCLITASVLDSQGKAVQEICYKQPSRPQGIIPNSTTLVWNGKNKQGKYAAVGQYTIKLICELPEQKVEIMSNKFSIMELKIPINKNN